VRRVPEWSWCLRIRVKQIHNICLHEKAASPLFSIYGLIGFFCQGSSLRVLALPELVQSLILIWQSFFVPDVEISTLFIILCFRSTFDLDFLLVLIKRPRKYSIGRDFYIWTSCSVHNNVTSSNNYLTFTVRSLDFFSFNKQGSACENDFGCAFFKSYLVTCDISSPLLVTA